ncbi:MAG: hypothetical protein Q9163_000191 [Psora crenata]
MRHALLLNACTRPEVLYIELLESANHQLSQHFPRKSVFSLDHHHSHCISHQASLGYHSASKNHSVPKNITKDTTTDPVHRCIHKIKSRRHARRPSKQTVTTRRELKSVRRDQLSTLARMKSHIQFITTPTSDTPGTALFLHFDDKRYIFGHLHEGLQRAGLQAGFKFLKAKDFFLTGRTEWKNTGGILGMILTLADVANAAAASKAETLRLRLLRREEREEAEARNRKQRPSKKANFNDSSGHQKRSQGTIVTEEDPTLRIHGGPNLTHTLATARSFVFRQGMPLDVEEFGEDESGSGKDNGWKPTFEDNRIRVWAMPVRPKSGDGADEFSQPVSNRKRGLGEYMNDDNTLQGFMIDRRPSKEDLVEQWGIRPEQPQHPNEEDQRLRRTVVTEMFKSKWRFDKLVEMPLHQIKLPAAVFVRDPITSKLVKYQGPFPTDTKPVPSINVLVRQPWPGTLVENLPPTNPSVVAMSYIVRGHKQRGRFRPDEARKLNVPRGPLFSKLSQGLSVTSTDGNTVTPEMVLEPGKEAAGIAIIDLPTREYVSTLLQRPEFTAEDVMAGVKTFIWLLGPGVAQDETLLRFMVDFKDMNHIVSSPDVCADEITMTSAAAELLRHRQIDPFHYPVLHYNNKSPAEGAFNQNGKLAFFHPAKKGLKIELDPKMAIAEDGSSSDFDESLIQSETPEQVLTLAQQARDTIASEVVQAEYANQDLPSPNAEVICLGTGSALPSLHRNVSATLLRVPGCGSYLLDCGENTLGQLRRLYSPAELHEVLLDLKLIWISHLHADHHLGITSVIKAWYDAVHGKDAIKRPNPSPTEQLMHPEDYLSDGHRLVVVGHPLMTRWLEEYSSVEDFGYDQVVPLKAAYKTSNTEDQCSLEWNGVEVGFNSSKNLSIGFKFSYSGDCRPSTTFAKIGKGSTVLLHEATFDDQMENDAVAKKHSTISEAIGVGVAMGARRVILTHFSQRYSTIPNMDDLEKLAVRLEDAEDILEGPTEGMDTPLSIAPEALAPPTDKVDGCIPEVQGKRAPPPYNETPNELDYENKATTAAVVSARSKQDMKIGVAFDYMRIKVKDIAHLERFTPAMRELYKEENEVSHNEHPEDTTNGAGPPILDRSRTITTIESQKPNRDSGEVLKAV